MEGQRDDVRPPRQLAELQVGRRAGAAALRGEELDRPRAACRCARRRRCAAPASRPRRRSERNVLRTETSTCRATWWAAATPANQQTVSDRWTLRNIITIRHARPVSPGTALLAMSASQRVAAALGVAAPAVALRLVGAVNAALKLVDLTVSYDRHPAVHHVSAEIPGRRDDRDRRPQRRRQEHACSRPCWAWRRASRAASNARPSASPTCRSRPRSTAPSRSRCSTPCCSAAGRASAPSARRPAGRHPRCAACHRGGRARRASSAGRSTRCRSASSSACCSRACLLQDADLVLLDEPFAAIDAKTVADLMDADPALAQREAHRGRRAARPRPGASRFPQQPAAGARAGRRPARRRACSRPRTCCAPAPWPRPGTSMPAPARCRCGSAPERRHWPGGHALRPPDRALRRLRLHAARPGGEPLPVGRRLVDRRLPDPAPHEPDGRRAGALRCCRARRWASCWAGCRCRR